MHPNEIVTLSRNVQHNIGHSEVFEKWLTYHNIYDKIKRKLKWENAF